MVACMLREDLVQEYWENERKKIKNSLVECLQNCKVKAESDVIDYFLVQIVTSYHVCRFRSKQRYG